METCTMFTVQHDMSGKNEIYATYTSTPKRRPTWIEERKQP